MKRLTIFLNEEEEKFLEEKRSRERLTKRERDRIEILLLCQRRKRECDIADFLGIGTDKVWRVKKRFQEGGIEKALSEDPRPGQPRKYTQEHETSLVAIVCTNPPKGRSTWTLDLLKEALQKEQEGCAGVSRETVRLMLKKTMLSLGNKRCGALEK